MRPLRAAAAAGSALLLALCAGAPCRADVTLTSALGFEGAHVPGTITPIRIEIASSETRPVTCRIEVRPPRSPAAMGSGGLVTGTTVYLAPGARKRITLPVLTQAFGFDEGWRLAVATDRRVLLRHGTEYEEGRSLEVAVGALGSAAPPPLESVDSSRVAVGLLGAPAAAMNWMAELPADAPATLARPSPWGGRRLVAPGEKGGVVALPAFLAVAPESAPDTWLCYEGLDAILWIDPDPEALKDAAPVEAVLGYAAHGGRLLVALTPGERVPGASPLARALPARVAGHDDVPLLDVVAALAGRPRGAMRGSPVPVARLAAVRGRVLASLPDGRPLAVEADHGLGSVVALAFDPRGLAGTAPEDRAALLLALFGPAAGPEPEEPSYHQADLGPLLNHLRKRFLTTPPLGLLILGLGVYVLAIGPLDYFLLKRRNRLRRTVVTFPLIVLTFTLLAWGASFLLFGGTSGQVRVAWLDFATAPDRDADVVRGLDFLGAYSPTGTTLELAPDFPRSFAAAPWLGSGGSYYGGPEGGGTEGRSDIGPDGRPATAVEIPLRSHRTLQSRFSAEVPLGLDAALRTVDGGPRLEIRNAFPVPVRDLTVVRRGQVAFLGDLGPGQATTLPLGGPGAGWAALRSTDRLPGGLAEDGLFSRQWHRHGGGADRYVPADGTEAAAAEARLRMGRAALGASLLSLLAPEEGGAPAAGRLGRTLARQGLDLSNQVRGGRTLVMGWCDADPLGRLPAGSDMVSTVVAVRRLLPAEGTEEGR